MSARITLKASSSKQAHGTKKPVRLTATVTAPGVATTGSVQFRDGKRLRATVKVTNGSASYKVSRKLSVKTHTWRATFVPATSQVSSVTSSAAKITVRKASAKVKAKLTKSRIKASSKARTKITVKVTANGKRATGKVTIKWGHRSKTYTLKKGKVTVRAPKHKKGTYRVKVSYKGNKTVKAKAAKTLKLKVR